MTDFHRLSLVLGLAVATTLVVVPSRAQSTKTETRPHALSAGAGALVFGINQAPSLNAFNGMLAYKHHTSEQRAYRLGVNADLSTQRGADLINARLRAEAVFLRYPYPGKDVKLYWGWGPMASIDLHSVDDDRGRQSRWLGQAGVTGKLGVEWFAIEHVSFFGEYSTALALRLEDWNDRDLAYDVAFGQTFASFGLAAYFR